ncbi:hypothetical protein A0H76_881 [Hepatospora eriocheir]|uniref:Uncharacterized protein n=1 Tax=Hepatospora eriocheir TaxID=1081669 RepID=A0A1X0QLI8_9MICR|nr:hypothetical protein A0H76_881 [Hepatospora eriocheir]
MKDNQQSNVTYNFNKEDNCELLNKINSNSTNIKNYFIYWFKIILFINFITLCFIILFLLVSFYKIEKISKKAKVVVKRSNEFRNVFNEIIELVSKIIQYDEKKLKTLIDDVKKILDGSIDVITPEQVLPSSSQEFIYNI